MLPNSKHEIDVRYNTKIKLYPNGYTNTIYCNFDKFLDKDFEKSDNTKYKSASNNFIGPQLDPHTKLYLEHYQANEAKRTKRTYSGEIRDDNLKRAREKIFDIVLMNDFKYFITGTFAENEDLDRTDPREVIKPLSRWFSNRVQRNGLQYVLTAERHKSTNGIHIHALVNDVLPLTYSGRRLYKGKAWKEEDILKHEKSFDNYKPIYNIDSWGFGWSTALPCDENKLALARYITKYVTKEDKKIFGKYYWSSKNLQREPQILLARTGFSSVDAPYYQPAGTAFKYKYDSYFSPLPQEVLEQNTDDILSYLAEHERVQSLDV